MRCCIGQTVWQWSGTSSTKVQNTRHDGSEVSEWRFVNTMSNPADHASRRIAPDQKKNEWFTGPSFLGRDRSQWPHTVSSAEIHHKLSTSVVTDRLQKAESLMISHEQQLYFAEELKDLSAGSTVRKSWHLTKKKTVTVAGVGARSNSYQTSSGSVGFASIFLHFRKDRNVNRSDVL